MNYPSEDLTPDVDPQAVIVEGIDVKSAVFVVPSDAPLPQALSVDQPSGSLYARLAPIAREDEHFAVVRISGTELYSLTGAWRALCLAKKVYNLTGLPGARYDAPFTAAARLLGLRSVEWAQVEEAIERQRALTQTTTDTAPYRVAKLSDVPTLAFPGRRPRMTRSAVDSLRVPEDAEAEND